MKTLRVFTVGLFISAFTGGTAFAQTSAPQTSAPQTSAPQTSAAPARFAFISTEAFGEPKIGITKYIIGLTTLNKEFEQSDLEIKNLGTRYENLRKEIEGLQSQVSKPNSPVPLSSVQPKIDEYGKLGREIQFKQEDLKAKYQSRANVIMNPILEDIGKALQDYTVQKGYDVIFDSNKLKESGLIIGIRDEKVDVTKDFISFYNARPVSTTTQK